MDDHRYRSQHSPRNETPVASFVSPPRNGSRMPQQSTAQDPRSNLPRRFTTDSGRVPTLSTVSLTSPQRAPPQEPPQDYSNAYHKVQLIEKKKLEYERIREQRRRFELEMQRLDQQQRREALELAQMEEEMGRIGGHQSEPTTPPEHHHSSGFPSIFSRPSRYSTSSLTSPPGFLTRPNRSGSQLASPPATTMQFRSYGYDDHQMPSRSVPTTRRNSDDEDKDDFVRPDPAMHRSSHALNRYSMPVTRSRNGVHETGLDGSDIARFLFGDEEASAMPQGSAIDESFPTLVRRDDQVLSASHAALDLALSATPNPEHHHHSNGWSNHVNRHRPQQSLSALPGTSTSQSSDLGTIGNRPASLRHSLDLKYFTENAPETPGSVSSQGSQIMATPPKLQSSFSSNDVPTIKNPAGSSMNNANANNHAQQHFHNHNASMGRIPAGAMPTRGHTRELSTESNGPGSSRDQATAFQSLQSALQASAPSFGPSATSTAPSASSAISSPTSATTPNSFNSFYPSYSPSNGTSAPGNFNMPMLAAGMQQMSIAPGSNGNMYPPQQNYNGYGGLAYNQPAQPRDSQARVIQHRRQLDNEAMSRYHNMPLDSFRGQIYELCKDQHGCRYLQKKLEERNAEQVHAIWLETNPHVLELMMDPFGNYLCQKLLEFCNDDERTVLIQNATADMVRIALNQHGTRALQKMIEYVSLPQQVQLIIEALRNRVVELIQDLNGNHVIQKCLNKLTAVDAQFIFDAVGNNCIEVGTHRHGCCVLQRCIDHASGDQKHWLISRITEHARILVQDPFGNYVVQYIIDLNDSTFTEPVVAMFQGCISQLSRHKFSSNVIEKCLRCAQAPSKDMIVEEMLAPQEMERLLRDSFANYVVQTALEYATPHQKYRLVEAIRPILPQIRTTPYGRRIQAKISAYDNRGSAASSGQVTPADNTQGQIPLRPSHSRGMSGNGSMLSSNGLSSNGLPSNGLPSNGLPNNGSLQGLGPQGMRQNVPSYPGSSVLTVPAPQAAAAPVPQQQFNPRAQANPNGARPSANGTTEGNEVPWL